MISKNELIAQLRGRRRSVEAEIKRVQEEQPLKQPGQLPTTAI